MWKVTFKGLLAHKVRLMLTGIAVVIGVAFMAGTFVLTDTVSAAFDGLFTDINKGTDAVVRKVKSFDGDSFGSGQDRGRVQNSVVAEVEKVPGVKAAEGEVGGFALMLKKNGDPINESQQGPPSLGFSWSTIDELNSFTLVEGTAPEAANDVVLDKASADEGEFGVGDTIEILTKNGVNPYRVSGITRFGDADSPLGASAAAWRADVAQKLLAEPGLWDDIRVVADDGVSQEDLAGNIEEAFSTGPNPQDDLEVITGKALTSENQSDVRSQLGFFNTFLLIFAGIALFVGAFVIFNTFRIVVAQRTRELALLRAVGASRRQILGSVLVEAVVVSVVASALGLVLGILLANALTALLKALGIDLPTTSSVIATRTIVVSFVVGVGVTLVSTIAPSRRASRVPPIAALRDVATESGVASVGRIAGGIAVLVSGATSMAVGLFASVDRPWVFVVAGLGLVFLGLAWLGPVFARPLGDVFGWPMARWRGIAGTLARENAKRNPRRTAATAAALMIGIGLVGFIAVFATSAKASIGEVLTRQFKADFVINSQSFGFGGMSPEFASNVKDLEGVSQVSPLRFGEAEFENDSVFIDGVDPAAMIELFDIGVSEGDIASMGPGDIAMFRDKVEDENLKIGDPVRLTFADTGPQTFTLRAIYDENQPADKFLITLGAWDKNFVNVFDSQVYVKFEPGSDLAEARTELDRLVKQDAPQAEVQDQNEFLASITGQIDALLNMIYALLFFAIIIALIGIANALALSVHERVHEIGLMRAVGMARKQVRSTVRWEAVIIALFGTLFGLVISLGFGWALVQALKDEGFEVFEVPIAQLIVITLVASLASVVAAILPARRAAKLDVLEAISTT